MPGTVPKQRTETFTAATGAGGKAGGAGGPNAPSRKRLDELRKLRASYRARGLEFEQKYTGEEGWSDEEEDDAKKSRYVNAFAARNAETVAVISTDAQVAEKYKAEHKNEVKPIMRETQNTYVEVKFTGDKVSQAKALERFCVPCKPDTPEEPSGHGGPPMPYFPNHIRMTLGTYVLHAFWAAFVNHGGDVAILMLMRMDVPPMVEEVNEKLTKKLPFDILRFSVDEDERVSLVDILDQFTSYLNKPNDDYILRNPPAAFPSCCVMRACRKHAVQINEADEKSQTDAEADAKSQGSASKSSGSKSGSRDSEEDEEPETVEPSYALETIFNRWKLAKKGHAVRKKHIPDILKEAKITYDKSRLPDVWWRLYSEHIVEGSDVLMEVVEAIRTDMDDARVQSMFTLPRWLKNEFSESEIEFFIHHFKSIDLDGGGSIDAYEFQQLTISLGSPVTMEEAQQILDDCDDDGSGTIDFIEFMTLMFRIQHGTLDVENNRLAQTIMESKSQLRILQEISEIGKNPPVPGLSVGKYGGCPVVCDYLFRGPPNTPFAGGTFRLRVKYRVGYPFSCPDVNFVTRIFCVNVMPKLNGESHLVHLSHLWDCNWNTVKLLHHVDGLLKQHDYSLIPSELYQLALSYGEDTKNNEATAAAREAKNDSEVAPGKSRPGSTQAKSLSVEEVLKAMPRVEQVLVTNTVIHIFDRKRFDSLARSYTRRFSENYDENEARMGLEELGMAEAEGGGADMGGDEYYAGAGPGEYDGQQQHTVPWDTEGLDWDQEVQYGNYAANYDPNDPNTFYGQQDGTDQQPQYYYDEATGQYYTYDQYYAASGNAAEYSDPSAYAYEHPGEAQEAKGGEEYDR